MNLFLLGIAIFCHCLSIFKLVCKTSTKKNSALFEKNCFNYIFNICCNSLQSVENLYSLYLFVNITLRPKNKGLDRFTNISTVEINTVSQKILNLLKMDFLDLHRDHLTFQLRKVINY